MAALPPNAYASAEKLRRGLECAIVEWSDYENGGNQYGRVGTLLSARIPSPKAIQTILCSKLGFIKWDIVQFTLQLSNRFKYITSKCLIFLTLRIHVSLDIFSSEGDIQSFEL